MDVARELNEFNVNAMGFRLFLFRIDYFFKKYFHLYDIKIFFL
jgi:hypothetical protein